MTTTLDDVAALARGLRNTDWPSADRDELRGRLMLALADPSPSAERPAPTGELQWLTRDSRR